MSEMSDQARGVIFVLIALGILLLWSHYFSPLPPPQKGNQRPAVTAPASAATQVTPPSGSQESQESRVAPSATKSSKPAQAIPVMRGTAERVIVVQSPLYRVELSNRGAVVRSWRLKKYLDDQKPPHPLDLVNQQTSQQFGWPFSLLLADTKLESEANSELYQVSVARGEEASPADQTEFQAPINVSFHYSDGHLDVTKTLNFNQNYQLTVETSVSQDGKPVPAALAWRGGFGDKEVYQASQLVTVFYSQTGKLNLLQYKKLGVPGNQSQSAVQAGPLEYSGIEDQFFTAAFIPDGTPDLSLWHSTQNYTTVVEGKEEPQPVAEMAAGSAEPGPLRMRVYVGPKDVAILGNLQPNLEALVNFGWTGVIAKPLLFILQWLYRYIPNYGWVIIVLTLIINFALFPLKMKSWRSMQRMQKVAPEIRSIQDRYKKYSMSDPRKRQMNEEVMAVYQREGINPMGSCLPMVFQMPIWWALWRVLTGAIELRHAPFLGWIHDLSVKDPYYILPIAMAITMYLVTKMTPQTTVDPAQQKMMGLMPLMFAVFFFRLSSGLNLYMFTSNLIGVGQQYYLNRTQPLPTASKFKNKKKTA